MRKQLRVAITSGGTISNIDDVRHVGNFSKGTTGAKIAEEFLETGSKAYYLHSTNAIMPFRRDFTADPRKNKEQELGKIEESYEEYSRHFRNLEELSFDTFESYKDLVEKVLKEKPVDVIVLAAAVSDYSAIKQEGKISSDKERLLIEMVRNPKVISLVKEYNPSVFQVGFKLLSRVSDGELIETAYQHGKKNKSDLTVANSMNLSDKSDKSDASASSTYLITLEREVIPVKRIELAPRLVEEVYKRINKK